MALSPRVMADKFGIRANAPPGFEVAFLVQIVPAAAVTQDVSVGTVEEHCVAGATIIERIGSGR